MVSFFKAAVRNFSEILPNLKAEGDKVLPKPDSDLKGWLKTAQTLLGIGGVLWTGVYFTIKKETQVLSKEISGLDQRITAVDASINRRADYLEKVVLLMLDEKIKNNPALKQSEKVESKI